MYYWAYGSNLNVRAMATRCPGAKKLRALSLPNGRLVFRGVADVEVSEGDTVHGGLWRINEWNERVLDQYEGVSKQKGRSGLYRKCYLLLLVKGEKRRCLYYKMNEEGVYPPGTSYLDSIAQGYNDFGLPIEALDKAFQQSFEDKRPTQRLLDRHQRRWGSFAPRDRLINVEL